MMRRTLFSIAQPNELSHQPIPSGFVLEMGIKDLSVSFDEQGISVTPGAKWFSPSLSALGDRRLAKAWRSHNLCAPI
jgi:hypothetical protein